MKVAKEKVWADSKGNLVPDGHEDAQVLVAAKGANIPDAHIEQFKGSDKYFQDAVFNSDGDQVKPQDKQIAPAPFSYNMVEDHGTATAPQPQNREAEVAPTTRAVKSPAAKKSAKKSGK